MSNTKTCYKCKIEKSVDEFNKQWNSRKKDKLYSYCKPCTKISWSNYYSKNRQSLIDKQKRYSNEDIKFDNYLYRKYKITLSDYQIMMNSQNGVCDICKKQERNGNRLSVDHDHNTGVVRGLLCNDCNVGLGRFGENVEILLAAINYLSLQNVNEYIVSSDLLEV